MIEHIVINGGGSNGLVNYGALKYLNQQSFWNIENIKTIHGTSMGGFLAVILCLKMDWEIIDDYFIKRPWEKEFNIDLENLILINQKKAILKDNYVNIIFEKLFHAKDLDLNITLKQFYDWSNIELNLYTTEINNFKTEQLNYNTFPDLELFTALKMTSAVPIMFPPVIFQEKIYVDGGLMCNYPINYCIEQLNDDELDKILAIRNNPVNETEYVIDEKITFVDFVSYFFNKTIRYIHKIKNYNIVNEVACCVDKQSDFVEWYKCFSDSQKREKLIKNGNNDAKIFLKYVSNMTGK